MPRPLMSAPGLYGQLGVRPFFLAPHVRLELFSKFLYEGQCRHRRAFAEGADGVAHDAVGHVVEAVELLHRRLAFEKLLAEALEPGAALPAGRALAARLVPIELHQA